MRPAHLLLRRTLHTAPTRPRCVGKTSCPLRAPPHGTGCDPQGKAGARATKEPVCIPAWPLDMDRSVKAWGGRGAARRGTAGRGDNDEFNKKNSREFAVNQSSHHPSAPRAALGAEEETGFTEGSQATSQSQERQPSQTSPQPPTGPEAARASGWQRPTGPACQLPPVESRNVRLRHASRQSALFLADTVM